MKNDPTVVPLWKGDRCVKEWWVFEDRAHPVCALCWGGMINLKNLNRGSCLYLPSARGCVWLPLRHFSLHCPQDDSTGEILFDEVFHALSRCLGGLLRPFRVPGSCIDFQPEIYVTIQAYSSIIGLQSHQVLHPFSMSVSSGLILDSPLTKSFSCLYSPCSKSPALLKPIPSHLWKSLSSLKCLLLWP